MRRPAKGDMTSITFYGGVNEIGGNKILLEDQDTRMFLDLLSQISILISP
jgi:mRNA degradation ribonuclease J1/J2